MPTHDRDVILESTTAVNHPATPELTLRTALKGTVGIIKAALHVDCAAEPLIRQRRSICAACP